MNFAPSDSVTTRRIKTAFLLLLALTLGYLLFWPPAIGVADNGDFQKMANWFGLYPIIPDSKLIWGAYFAPVYMRDLHHIIPAGVKERRWSEYVRSPGYRRQFMDRTDGEFVEVYYMAAFNRQPEPGERQFWLERLARKEISRGDIVRGAADSPEFETDRRRWQAERLVSSALLPLGIVWAFEEAINRNGLFDLRLLGLLYCLILLALFAYALPSLRGLPAIGWGLLLAAGWLVLGDVAYVSQFNSLFTDVTAYLSLVALLLILARMASLGENRRDWILALVAMLMFATSKLQHAVAGPFFAATVAGYLACRRPHPHRTLLAAGAIVLSIVPVSLSVFTPPNYPFISTYQSIFLQIVPRSADPAASLRSLAMPAEYAKYAGVGAYVPDTPLFKPEVAAAIVRVGHIGLAKFYLTHPGVTARVLTGGLGDPTLHRLNYLGNYERSAGPPRVASSFSLWSGFKSRAFADHGARYALFYLSAIALGALALRLSGVIRNPVLILGSILLVGLGASELLIAGLGDGADLGRHLFIFGALGDLFCLGALCGVIAVVAESRFANRLLARKWFVRNALGRRPRLVLSASFLLVCALAVLIAQVVMHRSPSGISLRFERGFSGTERLGERYWRWSDGASGEGALVIINHSGRPRRAVFRTLVLTGSAPPAKKKFDFTIQGVQRSIAAADREVYERELTLPPGRTAISVKCYGPRIEVPGDARYLVFGFEGWTITPK